MIAFPKRRWLRFSIRTLLVVVTIFCVWLGWQWRTVSERKTVRQLVADNGGGFDLILLGSMTRIQISGPDWVPPESKTLPRLFWIRELMGDEVAESIKLPAEVPAELIERIKHAFPESDVELILPEQQPDVFEPPAEFRPPRPIDI